jgi:hypothetical protein
MSTSPITQYKNNYKIRNWKAYNKSLCQRGSFNFMVGRFGVRGMESA